MRLLLVEGSRPHVKGMEDQGEATGDQVEVDVKCSSPDLAVEATITSISSSNSSSAPPLTSLQSL